MTGEELPMSKADHPMSRLEPHREPRQPRKPGRLAGKIWIAPDFDDTPEDMIAAFEGDLLLEGDLDVCEDRLAESCASTAPS